MVDRVWRVSVSDEKLRVRGRPFVELDTLRGFRLVPNYHDEKYSHKLEGFRGEGVSPKILNNRD